MTRTSRNAVRMVGGTAGLLTLFFMFAPEDRTNAVQELARGVFDPNAQKCLDYVRRSLKDPDSARLVDSKTDGLYPQKVFIHYKAKNGMGAYGTESISCEVNGDNVKETSTHAETMEYLNKRLEIINSPTLNVEQTNEALNRLDAGRH